jgi:hypothetical protein
MDVRDKEAFPVVHLFESAHETGAAGRMRRYEMDLKWSRKTGEFRLDLVLLATRT